MQTYACVNAHVQHSYIYVCLSKPSMAPPLRAVSLSNRAPVAGSLSLTDERRLHLFYFVTVGNSARALHDQNDHKTVPEFPHHELTIACFKNSVCPRIYVRRRSTTSYRDRSRSQHPASRAPRSGCTWHSQRAESHSHYAARCENSPSLRRPAPVGRLGRFQAPVASRTNSTSLKF